MNTFLFIWNPTRWKWTSIDEDVASCKVGGDSDGRWSCGVTRSIAAGDRAFLMKVGPEEPTGIMAAAYVLTPPYEADHFSDEGKNAWYVDLRYEIILHPYKEEILSRGMLQESLPSVFWTPRASGMTIPEDEAKSLEDLWASHLARLGLLEVDRAIELPSSEQFWEGAVRRVVVDAYERDPRARQACLQFNGSSCSVCGFDFESNYGEIGKGFIHVHHLRPLSQIGSSYQVNPLNDLKPVCPNCHSMLHRRSPPYKIEELREMLTLRKMEG